MQRRKFLQLSGVTSGSLLLGVTSATAATDSTTKYPDPEGPVTYYTEMRVPPPEKQNVIDAVNTLKTDLQSTAGYLSLSFKQTIGESTMGRGYPNERKGWIAEGYAKTDGTLASNKVPYFYVMFVRFDSYADLKISGIQQWFQDNIVPSLFAYKVENGAPVKTPIALDYHEGVYTTVGAADRENGYMTQEEIRTYLSSKQVDEVSLGCVSVNNHYMIMDETHQAHYDALRANLDSNTRSIFRPIEGDAGYDASNPDWVANGQPAAENNSFFRKAYTREILQNAFPSGDKRNYLMHGTWETIMDHENSHLDPRFTAGAGKIKAYMLALPVEPFYITHIQDKYVGQN